MTLTLQFLGATQTVTGSKYLLDYDGYRVLVDCGLFQGLKELRLRNWNRFPVDPASIHALILTHAHIDHTGYIPRLVQEGFSGPIYATVATRNLCHLLLPDAGHLQEEDARLANRDGFSKHAPAEPLFTEEEGRDCLRLFKPVPQRQNITLRPNLSFSYFPMGHILGASCVRVSVGPQGSEQVILFSGDIGRYDRPILNDPEVVEYADVLLVETTYGDRLHDPQDPKESLAKVLNEGLERGGKVIIPAFAVGRTQELLYLMRELQEEAKIPPVPIYVDSPMAIEATTQYITSPEDHDEAMRAAARKGNPFRPANLHLVRQFQQSMALSQDRKPAIVISAGGMATGGRVLMHLTQTLPVARNTILFAGYQAAGTRGRLLVEGAKHIKIHGQIIPVLANVVSLQSLSAHADSAELFRWLSGFRREPRRVFLVHGEPPAMVNFQKLLLEKRSWKSEIPVYLETVQL